MKKISRALNYLTWAFIAFVVIQKAGTLIQEQRQRGLKLAPTEIQFLQSDGSLRSAELFSENKKKVFIFWATWCAPCQLELSRIQKLFDSNDLSESEFTAISSGESPELVLKAAKERGYSFPIAIDQDGRIAHMLNINKTPTTLMVENGTVKSISSGLSLLIEKNIKSFFEK